MTTSTIYAERVLACKGDSGMSYLTLNTLISKIQRFKMQDKDAQFKYLRDLDTLLLSVRKLMKYSIVKAAAFGKAQATENQIKVMLLKVTTTCQLSHGDSSKRLMPMPLNFLLCRPDQPQFLAYQNNKIYFTCRLFFLLQFIFLLI